MSALRRTLESERLIYRPFAEADAEDLLRIFRLPEVRRYLLDDQEVPGEWLDDEIEASDRRFGEDGAGLFSLWARDGAHAIGFTGFRPFFDPPELQLVYGLDPAWWGRGLAAEAARCMIAHAFDALGHDEVVAVTDPPNVASMKVMQRAGLHYQGTFRRDGRDCVTSRVRRGDGWRVPAAGGSNGGDRLAVAVLCTHNSARSQLAEGLLRTGWSDAVRAMSAGTEPSSVRAEAVEALGEIGVDASSQTSKSVEALPAAELDIVVTVCDDARESCPYLPARLAVEHRAFADPSREEGGGESRLEAFRRTRDELASWLEEAVPRWLTLRRERQGLAGCGSQR